VAFFLHFSVSNSTDFQFLKGFKLITKLEGNSTNYFFFFHNILVLKIFLHEGNTLYMFQLLCARISISWCRFSIGFHKYKVIKTGIIRIRVCEILVYSFFHGWFWSSSSSIFFYQFTVMNFEDTTLMYIVLWIIMAYIYTLGPLSVD